MCKYPSFTTFFRSVHQFRLYTLYTSSSHLALSILIPSHAKPYARLLRKQDRTHGRATHNESLDLFTLVPTVDPGQMIRLPLHLPTISRSRTDLDANPYRLKT